jgi:NAD-dependent SIR2 family protein deacetylase
MLGAGASLSSGIKLTKTIMEEIVAKYAPASAADGVDDAFGQLWRESNPDDRELMLASYLDGTPSPGYGLLAELIQLGFFDMVITFNFDRLLEKALDSAGFRDYATIIRGETDADALPRLLQRKDPRVKILKVHGSLVHLSIFCFLKDEMLNSRTSSSLFEELTRSTSHLRLRIPRYQAIRIQRIEG